MAEKELSKTLRTAAQSVDNIALKMLLLTAADRIESPCPTCEALARTVMMDQTGRDA